MPDAPDVDVADDEHGRLEARLRIAEKTAKEAVDLKTEITALRREAAFRKAGIDPDNAKYKWLVRGYDGELTVDAIKAEAESSGLIDAPKPDPDAEALARTARAASGADAVDTGTTAEYHAELAKANSTEEAMAVAVKYGRLLVQE